MLGILRNRIDHIAVMMRPTGVPHMAKQPKTLEDLFHDSLKDIYFAEKKILYPPKAGESRPKRRS